MNGCVCACVRVCGAQYQFCSRVERFLACYGGPLEENQVQSEEAILTDRSCHVQMERPPLAYKWPTLRTRARHASRLLRFAPSSPPQQSDTNCRGPWIFIVIKAKRPTLVKLALSLSLASRWLDGPLLQCSIYYQYADKPY